MCKGEGGGGGATTFGPIDASVAARKVREAVSCLNAALYEAFAAGVRCEVSTEKAEARKVRNASAPCEQITVGVQCWREA